MLELLVSQYSLFMLVKVHWIFFGLLIALLYWKWIVQSSVYSVHRRQMVYFFLAIILFTLLKATPIDVIGKDYLFSVHILQLSLTYFLVVPLLLLGLPKIWLRQYIWHYRTKFVFNLLSHPWLTLIAFNGLLSVYFIPTVFNIIHGNLLLSALSQCILFMNAFFMWWVIIQPIPEMKGLNYLLRALYIFLASALLMPTGFFYIVVQKAHFPSYLAVEGALIPVLTAIYDQQLAGGLLKFIQIVSYAYALLIIFFQWGKEENAKEGKVEEKNIRYARGVVIHLKDKK